MVMPVPMPMLMLMGMGMRLSSPGVDANANVSAATGAADSDDIRGMQSGLGGTASRAVELEVELCRAGREGLKLGRWA